MDLLSDNARVLGCLSLGSGLFQPNEGFFKLKNMTDLVQIELKQGDVAPSVARLITVGF